MSELRIYSDRNPAKPERVLNRFEDMRGALAAIGVEFERWQATRELAPTAGQDEVLAAYHDSIERLKARYGFKSVDVISMYADHPKKDEMRDKFLHEHTHDDFEVRFFVEGRGLFNLRKDGKVYAMLCERGDLLSVPAGTTHWFDMGPQPVLKAIRLFVVPEGWVAKFTGDAIADRFPRLEEPHYKLSQAA